MLNSVDDGMPGTFGGDDVGGFLMPAAHNKSGLHWTPQVAARYPGDLRSLKRYVALVRIGAIAKWIGKLF